MRTPLILGAAATALSLAGPLVSLPQGAPDGERHLRNVRQLTYGGENAEAYFSPDGTPAGLPVHARRGPVRPDLHDEARRDGREHRVSTGTGRTTCGYFYPAGGDIVFASTHETSAACPPKPSFARGYVWPIYDGYEHLSRQGGRLGPDAV